MSLLRSAANRFLPESRVKETLRYLSHPEWKKQGWGFDFSTLSYTIEYADNSGERRMFHFPFASDKEVGYYFRLSAFRIEVPGYLDAWDKSSIIIDAGAYPGDLAFAAASLPGVEQVIALEPNPRSRAYTQQVLDANNLSGKVKLLPYALADREGMSTFTENHQGSALDPNGKVIVKTVTLDGIIKKYGLEGRKLFVKMDIEGAELMAVLCCQQAIAAGSTFVIAAYHTVDGQQTYVPLTRVFELAGYQTKLTCPEHLLLVASPRN